MDDLITFTSSAIPDTNRVLAFRGTEAMSSPYEFEIFLALSGGAVEPFDIDDGIGAKASLTIDRAADGLPPHHFSGVLASVDLLHEIEGLALVRAVLVPRLWLLGLTKHSRIFTRMSVPEIIKSVLADNGLDNFELRLGSYEPEEHVCQYRESDLDFLSRWMEREGMYYFFEHGDRGEKLIICDSKTYEEDLIGKPVRYHPQVGHDRSAGASFRTFTCRKKALPAKVELRDYDYAKPNLSIAGSSDVDENGTGEVNVYGDRFFTPAAGERLAKLRAQDMLARQIVFHALGTRTHLRPGHVFELEDHPRAAFNAKYLTIEARHWGNQRAGQDALSDFFQMEHEDVYFVEVTSIPAETQFRAGCRTPWPRIYGFENGTICGSAESEYAQIDDQGRYKVRFKFDESGLKNGKGSTYVRMMQPHGGSIEGFHFPLRKATEVVISFLGGDPDRPVITGVVPNALTPSPVTGGNHTKNVIQTGGRNRLELEDKAGQQRVTLSTPYSNTYIRMGAPNDEHELIVKTDDNTELNAGKNFDQLVGQNGGGSWVATIKDNWTTHVQSGEYSLYVDSATWLTQVKGETWLHVTSGNYLIDVDTGTMTTNVKSSSYTTVKGAEYKVNVTAGNTKIDTKGTTDIVSKGKLSIVTQDASDYHVASSMDYRVDGECMYSVGGAHTVNTGARTEVVDGDYIQTINGAFNQTTSSSADFWTAAKSSRTLGLCYSLNVGAKASVDVSASASLGLSAVLAVSAGIKLEAKASAGLSMTAACEIDVASVKFDQKGLKFDTAGCGIKNVGTAIQLAAICMFA